MTSNDVPRKKGELHKSMSFIGSTLYDNMRRGHEFASTEISVMLLVGKIDIDDFRKLVRERLITYNYRMHSIPRKDEKGNHYYEQLDPDSIDLKQMVQEVTLDGKGDKDALEDFLGDQFAYPMEKNDKLPLWRFYLPRNFRSGECETAIIFVVNHCLGDGIAFVKAFYSLYDKNDNDNYCVAKKRKRRIGKTMTERVHTIRSIIEGFARALVIPFMPSDPSTMLKLKGLENLSGKKVVSIGKAIPIDRLKYIKNCVDGTINDVFVAALSRSLNRLLTLNDCKSLEKYKNRLCIRGVFPFSFRDLGTKPDHKLHNDFTFVPLKFPIGIKDPLDMLLACKNICDELKTSPETAINFYIQKLAYKILPKEILKRFQSYAVSKFTLTFSNVPGAAVQEYVLGKKLVHTIGVANSPFALMLIGISYNSKFLLATVAEPSVISKEQTKQLDKFFYEEIDVLEERCKALKTVPYIKKRTIQQIMTDWSIISLFVLFIAWIIMLLF